MHRHIMLKFILAIIEKSYMEEKMNIKKIKKVIADLILNGIMTR